MAMHLPHDPDSGENMLSSINTTPLVDVMLVLLIIFLITIPVVTTSIQVRLPRETVNVRETRPENIIISVDAAGRMYWYDAPVPDVQGLTGRLAKVAAMKPQPEVQIRGDLSADYEPIGKVVHAAQRAGIARLAFITEPAARGR